MNRVELKVTEMNCAACSSAVEKALSGVEGVESASVAFTTGRATVIGTNLTPDTLIKESTNAGYPASLIGEGVDPAAMASEALFTILGKTE